MAETVYSRRLRVLLTQDVSRLRVVDLVIERSPEARQNVFNLRLTDPGDFFFLYAARIDEREFQQLKSEQQLTIDFSSFATVLVELLNECADQETQETPTKRLELNIQTLRTIGRSFFFFVS